MSPLLLAIYQVIYRLYQARVPVLPNLLNKIFIRLLFGCHIGTGAKIGKGTVLAYGGLGIVIHQRAVIGNRVVVGPCVTIGGTSNKYDVPVIGDKVFIGAGAKILGPVKVGEGSVIGANAVVMKDVPAHCMVVGIPAKVVRENIDVLDYKKL